MDKFKIGDRVTALFLGSQTIFTVVEIFPADARGSLLRIQRETKPFDMLMVYADAVRAFGLSSYITW